MDGHGTGADASRTSQRLLDKCLAKDPAARYQTARDLVVDLRSLLVVSIRRRAARDGRDAGRFVVARARDLAIWAVPLALAAAGVVWWTHRAPPPPPPLAQSGKPSVAVLYFQNNTGNPQLDWLRTGLTDMVVTDLSQSPETGRPRHRSPLADPRVAQASRTTR